MIKQKMASFIIRYTTAAELDARTVVSEVHDYGGGGYILKLSGNIGEARIVLSSHACFLY